MTEIELFEYFRLGAMLRENEFEFITGREYERCVGLGAHADPVEPERRGLRAVRLDGDGEAARMQRVDGGRIELEQRLAAGANHETPASAFVLLRPAGVHGVGEFDGGREAPPIGPDSDEIGVAELADGRGAVFLAPRPQIAPRKAQEHGGP